MIAAKVTPQQRTLDLFTLEMQPPVVGDLYDSMGLYVYRVTEVRPVNSRVWWNRWKITTVRVGFRNDHLDDLRAAQAAGTLYQVGSYGKGEGPIEFARRNGYPTSEAEASA